MVGKGWSAMGRGLCGDFRLREEKTDRGLVIYKSLILLGESSPFLVEIAERLLT